MTQTSDNVTWLTQEAYDQLKAELEYLSGPARAEIAKKIEAAREEGDLKRERRVPRGQGGAGQAGAARAPAHPAPGDTRRSARPPRTPAWWRPGMVVTIAFDGDPDDTMTFLLASREYASSRHRDLLPAVARWARGVNGKKVGADAEYELPNGKQGVGEDPRGQAVPGLRRPAPVADATAPARDRGPGLLRDGPGARPVPAPASASRVRRSPSGTCAPPACGRPR